MPILTLSDELAAYRWGADDIGPLVRGLSAAMAAEVDVITSFDAAPLTSLARRRTRSGADAGADAGAGADADAGAA